MLLLSIHPRFVESIFSGEKAVELRKRRPNVDDGDCVVIYSTSPVCKVVGFATISHIESASPPSLWRRVRKLCGIKKAEYDEYFQNSNKSVGIFLTNPTLFEQSFSLDALRESWPGFHPPQQFQYLDQSQLNFLFESSKKCA